MLNESCMPPKLTRFDCSGFGTELNSADEEDECEEVKGYVLLSMESLAQLTKSIHMKNLLYPYFVDCLKCNARLVEVRISREASTAIVQMMCENCSLIEWSSTPKLTENAPRSIYKGNLEITTALNISGIPFEVNQLKLYPSIKL